MITHKLKGEGYLLNWCKLNDLLFEDATPVLRFPLFSLKNSLAALIYITFDLKYTNVETQIKSCDEICLLRFSSLDFLT